MKLDVRNSYEWVYPDDEVTGERRNARVNLLRGSSDSFCVLCDGDGGYTGDAFFADMPQGLSVSVYRALPVRVSENTGVLGFTLRGIEEPEDIYGADGKPYYTREAPFYVYDALTPVESGDTFCGKQCFFIEIKADGDAKAGEYSLECEVFKQSVRVDLHVYSVNSPKETLYITNWYSVGIIANRYHVEKWSDAHFALIEKYIELMRLGRQNTAWITHDTVNVTSNPSGGYCFDFTNADRLIDLLLSHGITCIEGAPVYGRKTWADTEFGITTPAGRVSALSDEGRAYAVEYLRAWAEFVAKKGLSDCFIQHVGDEPHGKCRDEYLELCKIVRACMPGIPLIEAVETYDLPGGPDIFVPKNDYYERHIEQLEAIREQGNRLWFYTCCIPGGFYMNRLLDMPLLKTRYLHWGNFAYNIEGYLHWGFNHLSPEADTLEYAAIDFQMNEPNRLPAGDTHIVYSDGKKPLRSLRLEQERAGAEEYELFKILNQSDAKRASELLGRCFTSFHECSLDAGVFIDTREQLLAAVEKIS